VPETRTIVLMGVAGSGKTALMDELVRLLGWPAAEGDEFHPAANVARMASGRALTDEDRWPWLRSIAEWIGERELAGESCVVTCSALKRRYRDLLRDGHPSVRFVQLTAPEAVLAERIAHRTGHFMPVSLLDSQLADFEPLAADELGIAVSTVEGPEELARRLAAVLGPA
jgi:gluconokinase